MIKTTTVDFLRHGAVNGGGYFRGVTDDALTEQGLRQMQRQCAGRLWDAVISSPLRRCAAFALTWSDARQISFEIEPAWMELDFGDWEGKTAEQIALENPKVLQNFYDDPYMHTPPNGERYENFLARIRQGWEQVLLRHSGRDVLIVTHAGVIRALFTLLLGVPVAQGFQIDVPHACLTRLSCFDDGESTFIQLNFHKPA